MRKSPQKILLILCCVTIPLLCGILIGINNFVKLTIFILAVPLPITIGTVLIFRYFKDKKWLSLVMFALLIGFVGFEVSILSVLDNSRGQNINWIELLSNSVFIALGLFIFVIMIMPLNIWIYRIIGSRIVRKFQ